VFLIPSFQKDNDFWIIVPHSMGCALTSVFGFTAKS